MEKYQIGLYIITLAPFLSYIQYSMGATALQPPQLAQMETITVPL